MEQNKQSAEFNRMTVLNFRMMDATTLQALASDLSLALTPTALFHTQQYFAMREGRDPTVGELRFLNALARTLYHSPYSIRMAAASGDEELSRALLDLSHKRASLFATPDPTLLEALGTAGEFLQHSGVFPYTDLFYADTAGGLAAACRAQTLTLVAELAHTSAAILRQPPQIPPSHGMLLLLSPGGERPFATEISLFLAHVRELAITPIALIGAEGILPHLLSFGGVALDLAAIEGYDPTRAPSQLLGLGEGKLLLLCEEKDIAALRGAPPQLATIGALTHSGRLQLREGLTLPVSMELAFLQYFGAQRPFSPELKRPEKLNPSLAFAQNADELLLGAEIEGDAESALLLFATKAFEKGAALDRAVFSTALLLPAEPTPDILNTAFSQLAGFHRACCELTLPSVHNRLILDGTLSSPVLAVWLAAAKVAPREGVATPQDWESARQLFFGKAD